MPNRSKDWLQQAEHDLGQAEDSARSGRHDWACFAAHQAAEKAVKALHLRHGQEAWGHVIARLMETIPAVARAPGSLVEAARILDNYYIPARYPNGHTEGPAFEHFGALQSEQAIRHAREILEYVRPHVA
jgi:HEPN domain-containing protein